MDVAPVEHGLFSYNSHSSQEQPVLVLPVKALMTDNKFCSGNTSDKHTVKLLKSKKGSRNYNLLFSQGGPVPVSAVVPPTAVTKIPAPDMTTLVTLEVHSPGDNDSVLQVPVRCRFSFYPYSKTIKINLQVSGTQTFGEFNPLVPGRTLKYVFLF